MKIAVCDDEPVFLEIVKRELEQYYQSLDVEIKKFSSGKALIQAVKEDPFLYLCIFLDIEMPGMTGLQTAKELERAGISIPVILLTSHTEYALKGYEVGAFRFLTKPADQEELHRVLKAVENQNISQRRLVVNQDGRSFYLPLDQILYFKSENVYIVIQTEQGHYLVRKKIKEQQEELPVPQFFRVHRSYIINMAKLQDFDGKKVTLKGGISIPVGRGRREEFQKAAARYMIEN